MIIHVIVFFVHSINSKFRFVEKVDEKKKKKKKKKRSINKDVCL